MKNDKLWKLKKSGKNFHVTFLLSDCIFVIVLVKISILSWKSPRISKFHGFIHNTYFIFSNIYSCKFIHNYNFLCGLGVSIPDSHLEDPGSIPPSSQDLFYFFLLFLGLSQIFNKTQSWNSRYDHFFWMNIKILTIRIPKK